MIFRVGLSELIPIDFSQIRVGSLVLAGHDSDSLAIVINQIDDYTFDVLREKKVTQAQKAEIW